MTRILIVDDDDAIRETLRDALEEEGYEVAEAADGIEGLAQLRASQERLVVLLDQLMPRLDGKGVLRAVQDDPLLARQHAYILLTAHARMSARMTEYIAALSIPIVSKPFDLEVLFQVVAKAARRLEEMNG